MNNVQIEVFEGPLDLLLNLIKKNELDINDIPISFITTQYLEYIYSANELNIDLACEFIVMAAELVAIKSKMMLPALQDEEQPSAEEQRDELTKRLIQYQVFQSISEYIKEKEISYLQTYSKEEEYFPELSSSYLENMKIDTEILSEAIAELFTKINEREDVLTHEIIIERESISVEDKLLEISNLLNINSQLSFFELFRYNNSKVQIVTTFLAILELLKLNTVILQQNSLFSDIDIIKVEK